VSRIFTELNAQEAAKRKPKPRLKPNPSKEEHKKRKKEGAAVGQDEGAPQEARPSPIPKPAPLPTPNITKPDPCRSHSWSWAVSNFNVGLSDAGMGLSVTDDNHFQNPQNRSLRDVVTSLGEAGWSRFYTNINPMHWGGVHIEGRIHGSWWHMIFYPAQKTVIGPRQIPKEVDDWGQPPERFEMHCERGMFRPSSIRHGLDYLREMTVERFMP
jgi:hypothetical protein